MSVLAKFRPLFRPAKIAVVGASATTVSGGNRFIRNLKNYGYAGEVLPIHPTACEIEGLQAFASLDAIPGDIDYAYVAVAARNAPGVIRSGRGKVRFAQVMSSGFGETVDGAAIEDDLKAAGRESGVRLLGPNCLGTYSPQGRVTFTHKTSTEPGSVGIVCQSGGLGIDIIRRGQSRGLRYSGLVTIGNAIDVGAAELIEYYLASPDTRVIGLYLESTKEGRRLFEVLRDNRAGKPVVLLKGGRTQEGKRAAASHTGALVGSDEAWKALSLQCGVPIVESLDALIDALLAFQCLPVRSAVSRKVVLFGNGGGTSVLGTDAFDRAGFSIPKLDAEVVTSLEALQLPAGSTVTNPIDVPAGALQQREGTIAKLVLDLLAIANCADVLVIHLNMTVILSFTHVDMLGNIVEAALATASANTSMHVVLVLRSDGEPEIEVKKLGYRQNAVAKGIPVFDELQPTAAALACVQIVEAHRAKCAE